MSCFHSLIGSMPKALSRLFDEAVCSLKMLEKMSATATGVTTKGSSTLMRQKVLARRLWSRRSAMTIATVSWGIVDSRKMLNVLPIEFQNMRVAEDRGEVVEADEVALALQQVPVVSETTKV